MGLHLRQRNEDVAVEDLPRDGDFRRVRVVQTHPRRVPSQVVPVASRGFEDTRPGGHFIAAAVVAQSRVVAHLNRTGAALFQSGDDGRDDPGVGCDGLFGGARGEEVGLDEDLLAGNVHRKALEGFLNGILETGVAVRTAADEYA